MKFLLDYQINPEQMEVLYTQSLDNANLSWSETVIDAYCGIGTISLFLAKKAMEVFSVDYRPLAIEDAELKKKAAKSTCSGPSSNTALSDSFTSVAIPTTLARDLRILESGGYNTKELQPCAIESCRSGNMDEFHLLKSAKFPCI